jgi:DNA helicase-2/ATP-dependent DNA helicase PcrA
MSRYAQEIEACLGGPPTDEQWAAISMPLEPYVIVAGAGSGKTSVMAARVVHLALEADPRIAPGNVLCLTFTNKATENLTGKIRDALAPLVGRRGGNGEPLVAEGDEPTILNYHGFASEILRRHGMRIGLEPDRRILSPAQTRELCGKVLDRVLFPSIEFPRQDGVVDKVLDLAEQAANHLADPERIVELNAGLLEEARSRVDRAILQERIELAQGVRAYLDLKQEYRVVDFGDQIRLALRIVREHPDVVTEYRERFPAVLLDEYQDTNVAQAELLHTLFGDGHAVTAVGDPDQNIYAWRGASLHNLLDFPNRFRRRNDSPAARLPLYTNFRSGSAILAAADAVIAPLPETQRPDPDKRLAPWSDNGVGRVEVRGFRDEVAEAEAMADAILAARERLTSWSDIAVLCRTHRLYRPFHAAFEARGIPAEFTGLAGLLDLPEVVDLLAYARAVASPSASVAMGRILTGPRYRVGIPDLAAVAAFAKDRGRGLRGEAGERVPVFLAESLDHLGDIRNLSAEGRGRLEAFRVELDDLRDLARGPVVTFLAEVARRIGIVAEIHADGGPAAASTARRSIAAFLDQVGTIAPLEGDATLPRVLAALDAAAADEADEWNVPISDADAVKVMTIHTAKGLEFDTVFVPGLTEGVLPSRRIPEHPLERARSLNFALRGDAALLPAFDGNKTRFKAALRDHATFDERRTCYVALTRAKRHLWASGANWYEDNVDAKGVGEFLADLWTWGEEADGAEIERVDPPAEGETNPLEGVRLRDVPAWPGPARVDDADDLFPEGWRRGAGAAAAGGRASLPDRLSAEERRRFDAEVVERRTLATHLAEREREATGVPWIPPQISVNGLIGYARCPKSFYWTSVRPLPRFSGPAARRGTEIHGWIEERSRGQASLLDEEPVEPDLTTADLADDLADRGVSMDALKQHYLASAYADRTPLFVERSFLLAFGRFTVSGRIDAIYEREDGGWEIVDWKTGKRPADDTLSQMQLDLYALACMEVWGKRREELRATYFYLQSGEPVSHEPEEAAVLRARITAHLEAIEAARFDPTPGPQCRWCDFRSFCDAGTTFLATAGD